MDQAEKIMAMVLSEVPAYARNERASWLIVEGSATISGVVAALAEVTGVCRCPATTPTPTA